MDLVLATFSSPQFWAGTVSGYLLAVCSLVAFIGFASWTDEQIDHAHRALDLAQLANDTAQRPSNRDAPLPPPRDLTGRRA